LVQTVAECLVTPTEPLGFDPDEEERIYERDVLGVAPEKPPESRREARRTSWNAVDLLAHDFPEVRWAVPGLLAEGLNLIAGPPKLGKSWLALNIGVSVATGGLALGRIPVQRGDVLYLALEDTARRLQDRLRKVLTGSPAPAGLDFATECAPLPTGGADRISDWVEGHPDARLVIVDVWARVRGRSNDRASLYEQDYQAASVLKDIADTFGIATFAVHHTRKADATDFLDTISGTQGLAGAADAVLVLSRSRGTAEAKLKVTGRDIEEAEYALDFAADIGSWQMLDGPAGDYELGDTRRRILQLVRDTPATPTRIAEALGLNLNTAKVTVRRMAEARQLDTDGSGNYFAPSETRNPRNSETPTVTELHEFQGES
jgi:hypothetical protein